MEQPAGEKLDLDGGTSGVATVAMVLALLDRGETDSARQLLYCEAQALGLPRCGNDDHASELFLRALDRDATALRRCPPATLLRGWLAGTLERLLHEERRARGPRAGSALDRVASGERPRVPRGTSPGWAELDLSMLTKPQRQVVRLCLEGLRDAECARRLGLSRAAVRGRLKRALRRLRGESTDLHVDREWAWDMLLSGDLPRGSLTARSARLLLWEYVAGTARREIAHTLGTTPEAVRKRLRRWKKNWLANRDSHA